MREVRSLERALECGRRGWLSFPLVWFTKKPTKDSNGLYDAAADPDRIREMWNGIGRANIGHRCGVTFDVVDVDAHHGGLDTLSEIAGGDTAVIPCGPVVRTPNGGAHLYYLRPGTDRTLRSLTASTSKPTADTSSVSVRPSVKAPIRGTNRTVRSSTSTGPSSLSPNASATSSIGKNAPTRRARQRNGR